MAQVFYYLDNNNAQKGPFDIDRLKSVGLKSNTLVWTEGFGDWKPASEVAVLKSFVSNLPPPPPPPTPQAPPVEPAFIATTVIAKNFRCDGCGSSLEIPKNVRSTVKCKFCGTECVLDGIVKNTEIAAKENINSGISLSASPAKLHRQLVSRLYESPYIPLDAFEKIEVVCEEHHCVPAFCFECYGTMSFSYEDGQERKQTYTVGSGENIEVREKTYIDWSTVSNEVSITKTMFVPGENQLAKFVENLYMPLDAKQLSNQLTDIENLIYPANVETYRFDLPESTALNYYVRPHMKYLLETDVKIALRSKSMTRNLSMMGSNIKQDMKRVFLGLFRVGYNYNGQEYSMWATGDAERIWYGDLPFDPLRKQALDEKNAALSAAKNLEKKGVGWLVLGLVVFVIAAFVLWFNYIDGYGHELLPWALLTTAGAILLAMLIPSYSKKAKEHNKQVSNVQMEAQNDLAAFEGQLADVKQQFQSKKKALRGIYAGLSDDENAF